MWTLFIDIAGLGINSDTEGISYKPLVQHEILSTINATVYYPLKIEDLKIGNWPDS